MLVLIVARNFVSLKLNKEYCIVLYCKLGNDMCSSSQLSLIFNANFNIFGNILAVGPPYAVARQGT